MNYSGCYARTQEPVSVEVLLYDLPSQARAGVSQTYRGRFQKLRTVERLTMWVVYWPLSTVPILPVKHCFSTVTDTCSFMVESQDSEDMRETIAEKMRFSGRSKAMRA